MRIPLKNLLRGPQAGLAQLQDEALDVFYAVSPGAVLHGGTAIWRCYAGKRFSEDLDFYSPAVPMSRESFSSEAARRGLAITKFRKTENSIYAKLSDGRTEVSIEASLARKKTGILREFEKADGTSTDVYTLAPEELLMEKADAFTNRRLIRDFYDVYFLSGIADMSKAGKWLHTLLKKLPEPVDEKNLRVLVYSGPIPSFSEMVDTVRRRLGK